MSEPASNEIRGPKPVAGRIICLLIVVLAVAGTWAMLKQTAWFQLRNCYHSWRVKEGNCLRLTGGMIAVPYREFIPQYEKLVEFGPMARPFLAQKLAEELKVTYPMDKAYMTGFRSSLAYAIIDASGWSREEMQDAANKDSTDLTHYVQKRAAEADAGKEVTHGQGAKR